MACNVTVASQTSTMLAQTLNKFETRNYNKIVSKNYYPSEKLTAV